MDQVEEPQEEGRRLSYRFRLYPTPDQEKYFRLNFEACAFVYNHFLERRAQAYRASLEDPSVRPMTLFATTRELTALKKTAERRGRLWLKEADSAALVYALRHLDAAFSSFFKRAKSGAGKPGFPRPKGRKADKRSYTTDRCQVDAEGGFVMLPKAGRVKARVHRPVEGEVVSATVSLDQAGRWHVAVNVKGAPRRELAPEASAVGVFVGLDPWVATSDGEVVPLPEEIASMERKFNRELRKLRRREKGSAGHAEQMGKLAKLAMRIADARSHEAHALTRRLVDSYGVIVARDVDVRAAAASEGVSKEELRRLRRALADAAFGEINRQLAYKAEWAGRRFVLLPSRAAGCPEAFSSDATEAERAEAACREARAILEEGLRSLRTEDGDLGAE